jgi:hypothetical protein
VQEVQEVQGMQGVQGVQGVQGKIKVKGLVLRTEEHKKIKEPKDCC